MHTETVAMVRRIKTLALPMAGILLMGIIPLAVAGLRRNQFRGEMLEEVNALGRRECARVAKDVYLMLCTQHEKLKKEVRYDLNVAEYVMDVAGGYSLAQDRVDWTATNQSSGETVQVTLNKVLVGDQWLGQNVDPAVSSPVVDRVQKLVGARCTIFQRMNDAGDLLRVCTNVLKKDGARAIGTYIPAVEPDGAANPVVAAVLRGEIYVGRAHVVDDWYLTAYEPIFDAQRRVIGALFCGVRLEGIPELRKGIEDITVGRTGYAYVLGGTGEHKGRYIISRRGLRDGENVYNFQDASGEFFIRAIIQESLQTKNGESRFKTYTWRNPGEAAPRLKTVATTYFEPWDWVIGVGTYEDDHQVAMARIDEATSRLILWGVLGSLVALALCGAIAWLESGRIARMNREIAERKLAQASQEQMLRRLERLNQLQKELFLPGELGDKLKKVTDAAVALFELDFCRIWHVRPGDLCSAGCVHATDAEDHHRCSRRDACLHLMASSGRYTHIDGEHRRVPYGCYKIGRIASGEEESFLTNEVTTDPRVHDHEWAKRLGLVSFAGYKLRDAHGVPVGVLAMFAKRALSDEDNALLLNLAETTSMVIIEAKTQEAIRHSEAKYKTLYDASSDAIMYTMPGAKMLAGNPAAITLFGCKDEAEFTSHSPAEFSPEYQPDGILSSIKAEEMMNITMERGSNLFEWRHRRLDGSEFPAIVLHSRMELEGRPLLMGTVRDITEQKAAEEALRASERSYRLLADSMRDVVGTMNFAGRFTFVSPSVEQLLGYTVAEFLELSADKILTPSSHALVHEFVEKAIAAAQVGQRIEGETLELEHVRKNGSIVMTEAVFSGTHDESGQMIGIQGVVRDITSRKHIEEERELTTQRMEALLALSHMNDTPMDELIATAVEDAIRLTRSTIGYLALMNEDETVLTMRYWSKSAHASCKVIDKPIVYPLDTTGLWGEAVRQRQPVITNDYAAPSPLKKGTPEGHVPVIRHMNIPVFDGQRIVAVAGVGNKPTDYDQRDMRQLQLLMDGWWRIVKHRQYELELAQTRDEAQAANRAKSQFLATMSHEIRTPMTAILGYADLLMDPTINDGTRGAHVATIRRSGEHLLAIINDILDLSKIEAGKMSLNMGRCRLVSLLTDVASLMRPRAEKQGISFSIEYPGPIPDTIHTDGARLRQAIVNLAGNAVKFTEKGSVRIVASFLPEAHQGQPAVRIDVIDTGIGIDKDTLPQLFRPFNQGDPAVIRKYGGTGLGLAISNHIARLLGGSLDVSSELGQGSTFTLTIPAGRLDGIPMLQNPTEATVNDPGKAWTPETSDLTGVQILLAEDGLDNRRLIRTILQRVGAEVETAENGRIAVEMATRQSFDLILMDMNMPEMDGYEATSALRDRGYRGPIVALTANAMSGDSERCRAAGCDEYLTKPIDRARLIQTIVAFVEVKAPAV